MKLSDLKSNVDAEEEGVWVTMGGGWEAKIRSTQCKAARQLAQKQLLKNRRYYARRETPPIEVQDKDALDLVVLVLLADWRGLVDDEDNEVKCTRENAYAILSDPEYREMLDDISDAAGTKETFRRVSMEEDLGN